jgi:hypothetical protein
MKKIVLSFVLPFLLNASDLNQSELISFTTQKYKVDYNSQTQENKDKLNKEYEDTLKLLNAISNDIKNDADSKVAKTLLSINIWSKKYMQNVKISDDSLKELYSKTKPKSPERFNLYNILVTDRKKAEDIFVILEKNKDKIARLNEFKKQVNINSKDFISSKKEGNVGWVELQKLDKDIQNKIKDKKINDIFLTEVENVGWQIILINDHKISRELGFEESRELLTQFAKQQELIKKIQILIK